jgi:hypothetical protein
MKSRTEDAACILIGIILFASLYVSATMNALHDSYLIGVENFIAPSAVCNLLFIVFLLVLAFIGLYVRYKRKCSFSFGIKISKLALLVCGIVFLLNYLPCLYRPKDQNTLLSVISLSVFCPNYSGRSFFGLIITITFSVITFFSSKVGKSENT